MPKYRLTPQEKKILSYQKDCRNNYGQSDKGSRNSIPKRKAIGNRKVRRKVRQDLASQQESDETLSKPRYFDWRKASDAPLSVELDTSFVYDRDLVRKRSDKKGLRAEARKRLRKAKREKPNWTGRRGSYFDIDE